MFGAGVAVLILAIIMLYFCWILLERLKFCRILSEIPGPKSWPLVGNALQFDRTPQGKGSRQNMSCVADLLYTSSGDPSINIKTK